MAGSSLCISGPPEPPGPQPRTGAVCEFLLRLQDHLADASDKFNLLAKLERAQSRILSLESQVAEAKQLVRLDKLPTWSMNRVSTWYMRRVRDPHVSRAGAQCAVGTQGRSICVLIRLSLGPSPLNCANPRGLLGSSRCPGFCFLPKE